MIFNDLDNSNILSKLLYYIAPTNQLEETEMDKIKWFNIWYSVLSNIITGIFDFDNIEKIMKRRLIQSFFVSNYVGAFEYDGMTIIAPVQPTGQKNAWNEYTSYIAVLPDGTKKEMTLDNCVIGYNYTVPSINDNLLCYHYAEQLAEMELSVKNSIILSRLTDIIEVENENQVREIVDEINTRKQGAPFIIKKHRPDGKTESTPLSQPIKVSDYYDSIRDCLNEFLTVTGLSSLVNPNKKERLITDEISSNDDIKNTLLSNRVENMKDFIDEVNAKFGTDITVDVDPKIYDTVNDLVDVDETEETEEIEE